MITFCHLLCANHCRDWETITHSFANRNDIRDDSIILESPKILSYSPKSCLNLVSNCNNSLCFEFLINFFIKSFGGNHLTCTTLHVFTNESSRIFVNNGIYVISIVILRVCTIFEETSVSTRAFSNCNLRRFWSFLVPFIWADLITGFGDSMISTFKAYYSIFL